MTMLPEAFADLEPFADTWCLRTEGEAAAAVAHIRDRLDQQGITVPLIGDFHFNGHNLVVYGKEGDNYLISDPIMEGTHVMDSYQLERVRFAKGALAPRGQKTRLKACIYVS